MKYPLSCLLLILSLMIQAQTPMTRYSFKALGVKDGIPDNFIYSIFQDSHGYAWFATSKGLCRYDGYSVRNYNLKSVGKDYYAIWQDRRDRIWVMAGQKVYAYDRMHDRLTDNIFPLLQGRARHQNLLFFHVDHDGNLWFSTDHTHITYYDESNGSFQKIVLQGGKDIAWLQCRNRQAYVLFTNGVISRIDLRTHIMRPMNKVGMSKYPNHYHQTYLDNFGNLWMFTTHSKEDALYYINTNNNRKTEVALNGASINYVTDICDDDHGNIWIGTDNNGILIYNVMLQKMRVVNHTASSTYSIPSNHIGCLYHDKRQNIMWVGTTKTGVAYSWLDKTYFEYHSLPGFDDINTILETHDGQWWMGADGDGIINIHGEGLQHHCYTPKNSGMTSSLIVCSHEDAKHRLWFGTYGGGVFYYDQGAFHPVNWPAASSVRCIGEDGLGNIYLGTYIKGLCRISPNGSMKTISLAHGGNPAGSNSITDIYSDGSNKLYIATDDGPFVMDIYSLKTSPLFRQPLQRQAARDLATCIMRDSNGLLWVGTRNGAYIYNETSGSVMNLTTGNGLTNNYIRGICEGRDHNLWITTDNGLTNVMVVPDPASSLPALRCYHYFNEDGMGNILFNNHSVCALRNGDILVGGIGGFTLIKPSHMKGLDADRKVRFTSMYVANERVEVGDTVNGKVLLKKNLQMTDKIDLDYSDNYIAIGVSSLNFQTRSQYAYRLNDDTEWVHMDGNIVRFNRLQPGSYHLQVKLVDSNNSAHNISALTIHIRPPFYASTWAIVVYLILIISCVSYGLHRMKVNNRAKLRRQKMDMDMAKQHEIDETQLRFFTNISHDLRTPLSLILIPVEKLMAMDLPREVHKAVGMVQSNARLLLDEMNQILDMKNVNENKAVYQPSRHNMSEFIRNSSDTLQPEADKRHIAITTDIQVKDLFMDFDYNKMQRIMLNLISNAIKYNVDGGKITITLRQHTNGMDGSEAVITVADTGIGIKEENWERIFDRFFQESHPTAYVGNGIGLHIVKEYVTLHGGTISVKDNTPKGSVFTVRLPVRHGTIDYTKPDAEETIKNIPTENDGNNRRHLLIVEDNHDLRELLKTSLSDEYIVSDASNGQEAIRMLEKENINLVISDIMMPVMNGMELLHSIKTDVQFSHIPVILLTAKTAEENVVRGLREGADDYVTKPFSVEVLRLRIQKIINWSTQIHEKFKTIDVSPSEITVSSLDEQLIAKAIQCVEENMSNNEYSVEELSSQVGMTRGYLYRKLVAITGKTPLEFIRILRMKRGRQLLEKSQMSVSEIAYQVGFSPKQFSKYYKETFGILPSEYKKRHG